MQVGVGAAFEQELHRVQAAPRDGVVQRRHAGEVAGVDELAAVGEPQESAEDCNALVRGREAQQVRAGANEKVGHVELAEEDGQGQRGHGL